MARKNDPKQKSQRRKDTYGDLIFASWRMDRSEADEFYAWLQADVPTIEQLIQKATDDLYKLGVSADIHGSGFKASFTQMDEKHKNYNVYVVSRSDDPLEAIYMTFFKIYVLYASEPIRTDDTGRDNWG